MFVAALEIALCLVAYSRTIPFDSMKVAFVMGEIRVAPLKSHSIPRFVLQAALYDVLSNLLIEKELDVPLEEIFRRRTYQQYSSRYILST